jgi:hypothetical protein
VNSRPSELTKQVSAEGRPSTEPLNPPSTGFGQKIHQEMVRQCQQMLLDRAIGSYADSTTTSVPTRPFEAELSKRLFKTDHVHCSTYCIQIQSWIFGFGKKY